MDQREAHFQTERVRILMEAAKAVKAYMDANPEPHPYEHYAEPEEQIIKLPSES